MTLETIVAAKESGRAHSASDLKILIGACVSGLASDQLLVRWLKAVQRQGMADEETVSLVGAMVGAGARLDFTHLGRPVGDKHSTGGVGDKVSLALVPLLATCGLAVPAVAGRSLEHTGGTLDKLASIPGFRTDLSLDEFRRTVERVNCVFAGQTEEMSPADRRLYALRDRTGTVVSNPLICGSILSKKLAEGAQALVLDIKVGNGAFMETEAEARTLAGALTRIGRIHGLRVDAVVTDMNQPLGWEAGLANEVREACDVLRGGGPDDLVSVTLFLGARLLVLAGLFQNEAQARGALQTHLRDGTAFVKFCELVEAQGGNRRWIEEGLFPSPLHTAAVTAYRSGFITRMETRRIGRIVNRLTIVSESPRGLDPTGGVRFRAKLGAAVEAGEAIAECFGARKEELVAAARELQAVIAIEERPAAVPSLIHEG